LQQNSENKSFYYVVSPYLSMRALTSTTSTRKLKSQHLDWTPKL